MNKIELYKEICTEIEKRCVFLITVLAVESRKSKNKLVASELGDGPSALTRGKSSEKMMVE